MKNDKLTKVFICILTTFILEVANAGALGTNSGGGGNSINNQIIESYNKPIEEITGYKDFLFPRLKEIQDKLPNFGLFLTKNLETMSWYVIPARLKTVASEYTGLPFESDQLTVNNIKTKEVFIDEDLFNSLVSQEEKGRHLLHEILEASLLQYYSETEFGNQMKVVRLSVNLLSKSDRLTSEELSLGLQKISWNNNGWSYEKSRLLILTKEAIELEKKAAAEALELNIKKVREEFAANIETFRPIVEITIKALDTYCSAAGDLGYSYPQVNEELNFSEERRLKKELTKISNATTKIGFKTGLWHLDYLSKNGLKTSSILPLHSPVIKKWMEIYFEEVFAAIPKPYKLSYPVKYNGGNAYGARDLGSNAVGLYKVCEKFTAIKVTVYKFINQN